MKNCKDLISRYISVIGAGAVSVLVLNVIFLLFQNVIQLYLPAYMVEQVSGNTDIVRLAVLGITYFVVLMLATYFNGSHQKYLFRYRLKEIGNVYLSCFNIPVQNIERDNGKSEIEKALYAVANGNDIGLEAYLSALTQLITATLMFFIYLYMGRRLPLFAFAVFFLSVVLSIPLERRINREESEELLKNQVVRNDQERFRRCCINDKFLSGIRVVAGVKYIGEKLNSFSEKNIKYTKQRGKRRMKKSLQTSCLHIIRDIIIGVYILNNIEYYTISQIVLYINLFASFDYVVNMALTSVAQIKENDIAVKDFIDFIKKYEKITPNEGRIMEINSVRFENVSFGYEENKNIISNLSFEIKKGDKVAIVGANGQGKTTLVKLLMGIYTPTDGNIYVNDVNIKSIKKNDYQKSIAALFQENPIFAFSLLENIACEADDNADYDKINNIIDLIKMREAIDNLPDGIRSKYSNYFSKDGVFLSGGQMQKIYMARMFYKGGDLFILDEPTASLDPKAEREVYDLYNELLSDKITVFISHRLGTTRFCNRIIYLEGNNSNMGTFDDLYRDNDGFRKMYDEQKKYYEEAILSN